MKTSIDTSKLTIEEFHDIILEFIDDMEPYEAELLKLAIENARNKKDYEHIYERLLDPGTWVMPKVSVDTFLDSDYYLGIGETVYPKVREICREVIEGGYLEGVEVAWIGCERIWTKIRMADGSVKANNEIQVGDYLMWPDGSPRKVLEKHSGIDDMYEVVPVKWDKKYVTREHRLNGIRTSRGKMYSWSKKFMYIDKRGNTEDNIRLWDYLNFSEKDKKLFKLRYSPWVDYDYRDVSISPYFLGLWLGDWTAIRQDITTNDIEIVEYLEKEASLLWMSVSKLGKYWYKITCWVWWKNSLLAELKKYGLLSNKHIPDDFLRNNKEVRLMLLAWLLDSDGSNAWNYFEFYNSDELLIDQAVELARSLWFFVSKKQNNKKFRWKEFKSFKISICWDCSGIPTKIERKKCTVRNQKKDWLRTWIKEVNYVGKEEFIGFKVDGDELYLWEDFMVTHNSGKSFSSQILACYAAHHLLCLRNAHKTYRLTRDKNIAIMNMGTSASQALEVVFTGIRSFIEATPFFQQFEPVIKATSITFKPQKIILVSGNSKATTPLGFNVFYAILDEAAFYMDNDNKSVAEEIYQSLQRRIVSRFGKEGLLMMISSPRYTEDFIMRKLSESRELDDSWDKKYPDIFSIQLPTRKVKNPTDDELENYFFFDHRKCEILRWDEDEIYANYNVNTITDLNFWEEFDIWQIPNTYKQSFLQNPEKAKRDFGATPSDTLAGFFARPEILRTCWKKDRVDPVMAPGRYDFNELPLNVDYFIHIDIGLNRDGKGDHTGFAMGHNGGWVETPEWEKRIYIKMDLVERIGISDRKGEVDLWKIRERIYALKDLGFRIKLVTLDGYQSKDFMQILNKKWIKAEYLSVDRTIDAYNALKEAIYEGRFDCYYHEVLEKELARLELIKGTKVDHPPGGSKDVSDAVAWVVQNIVMHTRAGSVGLRVVSGNATITNMSLAQEEEMRKKVKQLEFLQKLQDKEDAFLNSGIFN